MVSLRVAVRHDAEILVVAHVRDRIVVARLAEGGDADDRVRPVEERRLVARHDEDLARLDALLHAHRDGATGEVLEVAANAGMAGRVDRAGEVVDLEDAGIRLRDAGSGFVR